MTVNSGALPSLVGSGFPADTFLHLLYGEVQRQALLMAFVDNFLDCVHLFSFNAGRVFDAPPAGARRERRSALRYAKDVLGMCSQSRGSSRFSHSLNTLTMRSHQNLVYWRHEIHLPLGLPSPKSVLVSPSSPDSRRPLPCSVWESGAFGAPHLWQTLLDSARRRGEVG